MLAAPQIILLLAIAHRAAPSTQGYACSHDRRLHIAQIQDDMHCDALTQTKAAGPVTHRQVRIWMDRAAQMPVKVTSCYKKRTTMSIYRYFLSWWKDDHDIKTWTESVELSECHRMLRQFSPSGPMYPTTSEDVFATRTETVFPKWPGMMQCCGWVHAEYTDYITEVGKAGVGPKGEMTSAVADLSHCPGYKAGHCVTMDNRTVLWETDPTVLQKFHPWKKMKVEHVGRMFISRDKTFVFAEGEAQGEQYVDGRREMVYLSPQRIHYSIMSPRAKRDDGTDEDGEEIMTPGLTGAAIQGAVHLLSTQYAALLQSLGLEVCHRLELVNGYLVLTADSPTAATLMARKMYGVQSISARVSGRYLEVFPCVEVEVDVLPMNKTCTQDIPVRVGGKTNSFMSPATRVLTATSPEVPCLEATGMLLNGKQGVQLYHASTGHLSAPPTTPRELIPIFNGSLTFDEPIIKMEHGRNLQELLPVVNSEEVLRHFRVRDTVNQMFDHLVDTSAPPRAVAQELGRELFFSWLTSASATAIMAWLGGIYVLILMGRSLLLPAAAVAMTQAIPNVGDAVVRIIDKVREARKPGLTPEQIREEHRKTMGSQMLLSGHTSLELPMGPDE